MDLEQKKELERYIIYTVLFLGTIYFYRNVPRTTDTGFLGGFEEGIILLIFAFLAFIFYVFYHVRLDNISVKKKAEFSFLPVRLLIPNLALTFFVYLALDIIHEKGKIIG